MCPRHGVLHGVEAGPRPLPRPPAGQLETDQSQGARWVNTGNKVEELKSFYPQHLSVAFFNSCIKKFDGKGACFYSMLHLP